MLLEPEEYIEQAYFYRTLRERMLQAMSTQELLVAISHEVLVRMLPGLAERDLDLCGSAVNNIQDLGF